MHITKYYYCAYDYELVLSSMMCIAVSIIRMHSKYE